MTRETRVTPSGAKRLPFTDLHANTVWPTTVCFADALVRFSASKGLAAAEPKTLRWQLWHIPRPTPPRSRAQHG